MQKTPTSPAILVIDDEVHSQDAIRRTLDEDFMVFTASSADEARVLLSVHEVALILCDQRMPDISGVAFLQEAREHWPLAVRIIISGYTDSNDIIAGINQAGIYQYILKPWEPTQLLVTVQTALAASRLQQTSMRREVEIRQALPELKKRQTQTLHTLKSLFAFNCLVRAQSSPLDAMIEAASRIASYDISVLLLGESGTGKELMAKAIHYASARAEGPFEIENCAAIPNELLESELFGHKRGAFTGAVSDHLGLFQRADGGTVLLDEIGETSPAFQVKLLRVLQEGEVRPVGSGRTIAVDVRVIAATHRDLEADVRAKRFREDLYYRLAETSLQLPPLRQRGKDIEAIARYLLGEIAVFLGRSDLTLTPAALAQLCQAGWPGNVRQLRNEIMRAAALSESTVLDAVDFAHLQAHACDETTLNHTATSQSNTPIQGSAVSDEAKAVSDLRVQVHAFEAQVIQKALLQHKWNKTQAAKALGLSRVGLQQKIQALGLDS